MSCSLYFRLLSRKMLTINSNSATHRPHDVRVNMSDCGFLLTQHNDDVRQHAKLGCDGFRGCELSSCLSLTVSINRYRRRANKSLLYLESQRKTLAKVVGGLRRIWAWHITPQIPCTEHKSRRPSPVRRILSPYPSRFCQFSHAASRLRGSHTAAARSPEGWSCQLRQ